MSDLTERLDNAGQDDTNLFDLCMEAFVEIERLTACNEMLHARPTEFAHQQSRERINKLEEQAAIDKDFIKQYQRQVAKLEAVQAAAVDYSEVDHVSGISLYKAQAALREALEAVDDKELKA